MRERIRGLILYLVYRYGGKVDLGMLRDEVSTVLVNNIKQNEKLGAELGFSRSDLVFEGFMKTRAENIFFSEIVHLAREGFVRLSEERNEVLLTEEGKKRIRENLDLLFESECRDMLRKAGIKTYLVYTPKVKKKLVISYLERLGIKTKATVADEYVVFESDRSYKEVKKAFERFPWVRVFVYSGENHVNLFSPPPPEFEEGAFVRVKGGEYSGFMGKVKEKLKGGKYLVHLVVFGKLVPVEVKGDHLEPVKTEL